MNKRKESKDRHVSSGLSLPNEMFKEIDKYILSCGTGESRSECIRNLIMSVLEEWKKDQQVKESIESVNKDIFRSPLGSAMTTLEVHKVNNNNNNKENDNNKPQANMLEQMFLTPFDEIVKNNLDDVEYMRQIRVLLKKRYEFLDKVVRDFDNVPLATKKNRDMEDAIKKNRELHPEINEGNK